MIADYAAKAVAVDIETRRKWNQQIVNSFSSAPIPEPRKVPSADFRRTKVDAAIVSVTSVELSALMKVFRVSSHKPSRQQRHRRYYETTVWSDQLKRNLAVVVTAVTKPLNVQAVRAVGELLDIYEPDAAFLVGIAAGARDKLALGDVVIPQGVHYYEPTRLTDRGDLPRPQYFDVHEELQRSVFYYDPHRTGLYDRLSSFMSDLQQEERPKRVPEGYQPRVVTRNVVIASGEKLLADGQLLHQLRDRYDERLIVADEESYGFALGCTGRCWWGVFRGISDFADPEKADDWQYVSAGHAAMCLRDFLQHEFLPEGEGEL
jgi:nucleoside phosphorylase